MYMNYILFIIFTLLLILLIHYFYIQLYDSIKLYNTYEKNVNYKEITD